VYHQDKMSLFSCCRKSSVHGPCLVIYRPHCIYGFPVTMLLPVTPPTTRVVLPSCPISPSKASSSFRITMGNEISDDTLTACANLFSSMVFGANRQAPSQSTQYLVSDQASEPLQSLSSLHREKCQDDGCKTTSSVFISPKAYSSGNLLPSGQPTRESPTLWSCICYCMGLW